MVDLVLRGDTVVTPGGVEACDIVISDGRIAAVEPHGSVAVPAGARLVDLPGSIVMPGGIDPHVHCAWPMPVPDGPTAFTQPASVVSRAAIHGGTTTLIDFVRCIEGADVQDAIARRDAGWKGACHTDYAFHLMVEGDIAPAMLEQLGAAIRGGHPTVKIFTTDLTPSRKGRMVDFGDIWEVFQVLAANQGLGVIHAEDNDIVMHMYAKLFREGRTSFVNMAEVHNTLSEDLSFRRVIRLAESVPGTALYMMHTSAATGVAAIREARGKGVPIYGESLHQYMLYTSDDYRKANGQIFHTYPSLKSAQDQAALWGGTLDGAINCVATDEICCTLAQKTQGLRIDDTTGGNAGVEPRVALMYTEMVGRRGYSLRKFVDLVSTNAAKIMGLYPRKGVIAVGADADICVLDTSRRRIITAADLHETDYTPWDGWEAHAWPSMTLLRGKIVMEGGRLTGTLSDGRFVARRIDPAIIAAPVAL
ncbi:amidohydrolase family protein [Limobrevibacterium gyesilva]|uniref:Amidohydrolase family protein n=1 Tax=Limobrevibacterium gyesilva TaxID=2991712 RepID=A0AA41YLR0_9PROT|nr:amidohydrolase family protein [Limobrevibacterium gyesilva]MCW3474268.1 amidohydrolase family protein [Limobrevibacterium gyesilva]